MIQTWKSWKRKNHPKIFVVHDNVFSKPLSVNPTMKAHGYNVMTVEFCDEKPFDIVVSSLSGINYNDVVYYPYYARDYSTRFIDIAYK